MLDKKWQLNQQPDNFYSRRGIDSNEIMKALGFFDFLGDKWMDGSITNILAAVLSIIYSQSNAIRTCLIAAIPPSQFTEHVTFWEWSVVARAKRSVHPSGLSLMYFNIRPKSITHCNATC